MKVIVPTPITLLSTNIPENSETQWASETTYELGDKVKVTPVTMALLPETVLNPESELVSPFYGVTPHKIYESLRGNNTNRLPKDHLEPQQEVATSTTSHECATGTKTFTVQEGKSFSPGMVVKIAKTVTPRTVNMTAEVISYSVASLEVSVYSATGGGTHANWTITSEDEIGFWKEIESTNQYKMFDEYINSKTTATGSIVTKLEFEAIDFITLFGLEGNTVTLELWDAGETELMFSEVRDLVYGTTSAAQIFDWYEYFIGEMHLLDTVYINTKSSFRGGVMFLKIEAGEGVDVACGNVIYGRAYEIGKPQYGMSLGIQDYSQKETDDQGRTKLVPGYWAKKGDYTLYLEAWQTPSVYSILAGLAGVPTAWVVDDAENSFEYATVYGTFRDFSVIASSHVHSWCNLEIDGLI